MKLRLEGEISTSTIEVHELGKQYRGVKALDGLSFQVEEGQIFGLLGPNGAGKSTAVRCLVTLTTPDSGTARVAGADIRNQSNLVRQRIGYVSQGLGADQEATGRENLFLHGHLHRLEPKRLRRRADELLKMLDLTAAADRFVRTYSGGMKRRLDIALGLLPEPKVLFLDEPTTGLDPTSRAALWTDLRRLKNQGLTILLTTHYLEEADQLADQISIVSRGRVIAAGKPGELKAQVATTISLSVSAPEVALRALGNTPGVSSIEASGSTLLLKTEAGAHLLPEAIRRLESAGCRVETAAITSPSLEDVYAQITGRPYSENDAETGGDAGW